VFDVFDALSTGRKKRDFLPAHIAAVLVKTEGDTQSNHGDSDEDQLTQPISGSQFSSFEGSLQKDHFSIVTLSESPVHSPDILLALKSLVERGVGSAMSQVVSDNKDLVRLAYMKAWFDAKHEVLTRFAFLRKAGRFGANRFLFDDRVSVWICMNSFSLCMIIVCSMIVSDGPNYAKCFLGYTKCLPFLRANHFFPQLCVLSSCSRSSWNP
jgi:hypothetical protein